MKYSNEGTQRTIRHKQGQNMWLDDDSRWHFSVQPPPADWKVDDPVTVEKAGLMHKVTHLIKKNQGIATLMRDAAQEHIVSKSRKVPILHLDLAIASIGSNIIKLNDGLNYYPTGINAARVNLKNWQRGDKVMIKSNKTMFGMREMVNLTKYNQSIDVIEAK